MKNTQRQTIILVFIVFGLSCSDKNTDATNSSRHERMDTVKMEPLPNYIDSIFVKVVPTE